MKKELVLSILVVAVIIGGVLWSMKPKPASVEPTKSISTVSLTEVSKHTSESDCWVVVSGNVYNVTSYIPNHPGGPQQIIPLCGGDATTAFDTRGGKGPHPEKAQENLNTMLVGSLAK